MRTLRVKIFKKTAEYVLLLKYYLLSISGSIFQKFVLVLSSKTRVSLQGFYILGKFNLLCRRKQCGSSDIFKTGGQAVTYATAEHQGHLF